MTRPALHLSSGGHIAASGKTCAMEAVARGRGLKHTASPETRTSGIPRMVAIFVRRLNDAAAWSSDAARTEALAPVVLALIERDYDTSVEAEVDRAAMLALWAAMVTGDGYATAFAALAASAAATATATADAAAAADAAFAAADAVVEDDACSEPLLREAAAMALLVLGEPVRKAGAS